VSGKNYVTQKWLSRKLSFESLTHTYRIYRCKVSKTYLKLQRTNSCSKLHDTKTPLYGVGIEALIFYLNFFLYLL